VLESILPVAVPNVTHPCYLRSAPAIVIAMCQKVFELATLADHRLAFDQFELQANAKAAKGKAA
jgi:hypothetical protein